MRPFRQFAAASIALASSTAAYAAARNIGEVIESDVPIGSAVSLAPVVISNVTSISLNPGDWTCYGNIQYNTSGGTVTKVVNGWFTTKPLALPPTNETYGFNKVYTPSTANIIPSVILGTMVIKPSTTTTLYLEAESNFSGGMSAAYGHILCRRVR